jgi:tRNA pseudouridine38-40 synthase
MTRYRAIVAYVGTDFHGWQRQANAPRTVQAVLELALGRFARARVPVEGAGRTDAGVHAEGQVAHFDLPRSPAPRVVRDAVNAGLPPDVRVLDVAHAADGFHARFDARWKEYLYRWSRAVVIPPRDAPFVAPLSARADAIRMREAASWLPGRRDFSVFGVRLPGGESGVRTLEAVWIDEAGDELRALFRGEGFLRGMVRSMAGVLADASRGRVPVSRPRELLRTGDRRKLSPKAPARGLTLLRVGYEMGSGLETAVGSPRRVADET